MSKAKNYFIILILTYISQVLLTYSISWNILLTSSKIYLYVCLTISSLISYVMQNTFSFFNKIILKNTKTFFLIVIFLGGSISLTFLFNDENSITVQYLLIMLTSIIFFIMSQVLEMILSFKVVSGDISSNEAAKILSSSSNIGALIGSALVGLIMDYGGLKKVIFICLLIFIILFVISGVFIEIKHVDWNSSEEVVKHDKMSKKLTNIYINFIILALSTVCINIFLIQLIQKELNWSVSRYGIIDAFAGIGSVFAVYIMRFKKFIYFIEKINLVALPSTFIMVAITHNYFFMCLELLLWGIFMASLYVKKREEAFKNVSNAKESSIITKDIVLIKNLTNSIGPVVVGSIFFNLTASESLVYFAIILFISLVITNRFNSNKKKVIN